MTFDKRHYLNLTVLEPGYLKHILISFNNLDLCLGETIQLKDQGIDSVFNGFDIALEHFFFLRGTGGQLVQGKHADFRSVLQAAGCCQVRTLNLLQRLPIVER